MALPTLSRGVVVNCCDCPTISEAFTGDTFTVATVGRTTVTVAATLRPNAVAVITVEPAATAVIAPVALTVAIAALDDAHVTGALTPGSASTVAVNDTDCPGVIVTVLGASVNVLSPITLIPTVPRAFPTAAAIVADPRLTPVTTPLLLTVAIAASELDQTVETPCSGMPFADADALSVRVPPTGTVVADAVMVTAVGVAGARESVC
jgi:hypothetical protein